MKKYIDILSHTYTIQPKTKINIYKLKKMSEHGTQHREKQIWPYNMIQNVTYINYM